eukprot:UN00899
MMITKSIESVEGVVKIQYFLKKRIRKHINAPHTKKKEFYFGQGFDLVIGLVLNRKRRDVTFGRQETYLFFKAMNEHMETQLIR